MNFTSIKFIVSGKDAQVWVWYGYDAIRDRSYNNSLKSRIWYGGDIYITYLLNIFSYIFLTYINFRVIVDDKVNLWCVEYKSRSKKKFLKKKKKR